MCLINGHGGDSGLVNDKVSLVESDVVPRGEEEEEEGKPEEEQELFHKGVPLSRTSSDISRACFLNAAICRTIMRLHVVLVVFTSRYSIRTLQNLFCHFISQRKQLFLVY